MIYGAIDKVHDYPIDYLSRTNDSEKKILSLNGNHPEYDKWKKI